MPSANLKDGQLVTIVVFPMVYTTAKIDYSTWTPILFRIGWNRWLYLCKCWI